MVTLACLSNHYIKSHVTKRIQIKDQLIFEIVKTLFLVPFERDIIFVDRVKIFEEINERSKYHRRVSLSGIAGVG